MATAANLVVKIFADISDLEKNLPKAERALLKAADGMAEAGKRLSTRVTLPLVAAAAATTKLASDAEESASKMAAVFGPATDSMNRWITQIQASIPASRKELQDMTSDIQNLLVPLGMVPSAALRMTQQITVLAADLASFNNISADDALMRIRSGLVGQYEPLLKFGVALNAATVQQEAQRMGLIHGKEALDANARAQAAFSLILKGTAAAHGDAANTANSTANQFKFLKAEATDIAVQFGQLVVPAARAVVSVLRGITGELKDLSPSAKGAIVTIGALAAAAGPAVYVLGSLAGAVLRLRAAMVLISGTTALAGLATSLTVLLPLLVVAAPLVLAMAANMKAKAEAAREAAAATDRYAAAVDKLTVAQLKMQSAETRRQIDALAKQKADLLVQRTTAPNNRDLGNVRGSVIWIDNQIKRIDAQMAMLEPGFAKVTERLQELNTPAPNATAPTKPLEDSLKASGDLTKVILDSLKLIDGKWNRFPALGEAWVTQVAAVNVLLAETERKYGRISAQFNDIAQQRADLMAAVRVPNANSAWSAGASLNQDALSQFLERATTQRYRLPGVQTGASGLVTIGRFVLPAPQAATLPNTGTVRDFERLTEATKSGFAQVSVAIGDTLAQNLATALGGRGRGAQIGGALGGAAGGAFVGDLLKGVGGVVGSAVFPVIGTLAGTALGGLLGGLFGHHEKAVNANTRALQQLTETIINAPQGYKVTRARSMASDARDLYRELGRYSEQEAARGGTSAWELGLA